MPKKYLNPRWGQGCSIRFLLILAASVLSLPASGFCADIAFPGSGLAPEPGPFLTPSSLYPGASTSGNTVTVNSGAIPGSVDGGINAGSASVFGNTVTINGGGMGTVYGGKTNLGDAHNNTVLINGGSMNTVYGGASLNSGSSMNNRVEVHNGTITPGSGTSRAVLGGYSNVGAQVSGNSVLITGGTISASGAGTDLVYGGFAGNGIATDNSVVIQGGTVNGDVYGGRGATAASSAANNNSVTISGGNITGNVYGGRGVAAVTGNTVNISGGTVTGDVRGAFRSSTGLIDMSGNKVTISGTASVLGNVYGGQSTSGSPVNNQVDILGGFVGGAVFGADDTGAGNALDNTVRILGGTVSGGVTGGSSNSGDAQANTITILGGTVSGGIAGGHSTAGNAIHNTITLVGTPNLSAASLFGGTGGGDHVTGNTLNIDLYSGAVQEINSFEKYNFFIRNTLGNNQVLIPINGSTDTDMNGTTMSMVGVEGGGVLLHPGDSIVLIGKASGTPAVINSTDVPKGAFLLYDFDVSTADGSLRATLRDRNVNPDSKVVPDGRLAAATFVNTYSKLIAGLAPFRLLDPLKRKGPFIYAITAGGAYNYDKHTDIDLNSFSFLTGVDWPWSVGDINFNTGFFVEGGYGTYTSSYTGMRGRGLTADGNISHYGAGLLAFASLPGNIYIEGSVRAGMVDTEFSSNYVNIFDRKPHYELSHPYFGAHAGVGYLWKPAEEYLVDVSAKYLWVHQQADNANILGDDVRFDAVDSQRLLGGVRLSYGMHKGFAPYVGVFYEYELDSKVTVQSRHHSFSNDMLRGGTGIGEIGLAWNHKSGLTADISMQYHNGNRDGVSGRFVIGYEF